MIRRRHYRIIILLLVGFIIYNKATEKKRMCWDNVSGPFNYTVVDYKLGKIQYIATFNSITEYNDMMHCIVESVCSENISQAALKFQGASTTITHVLFYKDNVWIEGGEYAGTIQDYFEKYPQ